MSTGTSLASDTGILIFSYFTESSKVKGERDLRNQVPILHVLNTMIIILIFIDWKKPRKKNDLLKKVSSSVVFLLPDRWYLPNIITGWFYPITTNKALGWGSGEALQASFTQSVARLWGRPRGPRGGIDVAWAARVGMVQGLSWGKWLCINSLGLFNGTQSQIISLSL